MRAQLLLVVIPDEQSGNRVADGVPFLLSPATTLKQVYPFLACYFSMHSCLLRFFLSFIG